MAFPGTGTIWMNGKLVDWKDATIHVASHVVHYGSAVFEGARCYDTKSGPACFRLDEHVRRDLQERLVTAGQTVRVYVPYGTEWWPYYMRRLAERPQNLIFILGSVLREGRRPDRG